MKPIPLQLVTVCLENGQQGVFFGLPLVSDKAPDKDSLVDDIWFSNIQEVPDQMVLRELIQMIQAQLCQCLETAQ
jgi:hypothetical protein